MSERLQKILAQWGVASRRHAETLISDGRVRLNGALATLGQRADPTVDRIEVDGQVIRPTNRPNLVYILLNKPAGVVSTCQDEKGRKTVLNLLPKALQRSQGIHPVGRLDTASTGALLLTNDGQLTFHLTHPRHSIPKTYHVWVRGCPTVETLAQWCSGVLLDGRKTRPAEVEILQEQGRHALPNQTLLKIVLREGRNRQIRRVADQLGHPVIQLHRSAIGDIELQSLKPGKFRPLTQSEINALW
ncbi:MAG: pseudouridine synthase [Leptolyngbyaceae bacterium]|nr:pseudouridine synthase [Leptolyngbyaceae bacterium]